MAITEAQDSYPEILPSVDNLPTEGADTFPSVLVSDPIIPTTENFPSITQQVEQKANEPSPPIDPEADLSVGDYVEDMGEGVAYGLVEGVINSYDFIREGAEWVSEGITQQELFDVEETENPFTAPVTIPGQITAGISQFIPGLIPGFGTAGVVLRVGTGAAGIAKSAFTALSSTSSAYLKNPVVTNYLAPLVGSKAVRTVLGTGAVQGTNKVVSGTIRAASKTIPALKNMSKAGLVGGLAEQFAFDPRDDRISNFLLESKYDFVRDAAEYVAQNPDDTEYEARRKMFFEGVGLGAAFDIALLSAKGLIAGVRRKPNASVKKPEAISVEDITEMDINKSKDIDPNTTAGTAFINTITREALEKGKGNLSNDYITKYIGSLNTNHILSSKFETYNLIKETADAMRVSQGENWQKTITNEETLKEAATLLGHGSREDMENALNKTKNYLNLSKDPEGNIVVGSGLENISAYAVAARQLLLSSNDVLFALGKEANSIKQKNWYTPLSEGEIARKDALKVAFVQLLLVYNNVQDTVNSIAGEAGRLLQSFNINVGDGAKPTFINDMVRQSGNDLDELFDNMSTMATNIPDNKMTPLKKYEILHQNATNKSIMEKIYNTVGEVWYNFILSAVDTNVINLAGNVAVQMARTFLEAPIAGAMGSIRYGTTRGINKALGWATGGRVMMPEEDPGSMMLLSDAWARIKGATTGVTRPGDATRMAIASTKRNNPVVLDQLMLDITNGKHGEGSLEKVIKTEGFDNLYDLTKDKMLDQYGASVSNAAKTFKMAYITLRDEISPEVRYRQYELHEAGARKAINIPSKWWNAWTGQIIGRGVRLPTTVMTSADTMFKSIADNAAIYEAAYRELRSMKYRARKNARKTGKPYGEIALPDGRKIKYDEKMFTLPGEGATDSFTSAEMIEYLVANPTKSMDEYATKEFLESTFQQTNWYTKQGEKLRRSFNTLWTGKDGINTALGTMQLPFIRTPINLMGYAFDRTLLGLVSPENIKARKVVRELGNKKGLSVSKQRELNAAKVQLQKMHNKQIVGMTYMTGAGFLAASGKITGGGPTDPSERNRKMKLGWRQYSVVVDGKHYQLGRFDPGAQISGLMADIMTVSKELSKADLSPEDRKYASVMLRYVMENTTANVVRMLSDKTYLKSMGELFTVVTEARRKGSDPEDTAISVAADAALKYGSRVLGNAVGGFMPNVVARVNEAFHNEKEGQTYAYDPYIRDGFADLNYIRTFILKATAKAPGLRDPLISLFNQERYFPGVDQFGNYEIKDPMPFDKDDLVGRISNSLFSVTREGISVLTEQEKEIILFEQKYRVKPLRVDRKVNVLGTKVNIELSPSLYAFRSIYQGRAYKYILLRQLDALRNLDAKSKEGGERFTVLNKQIQDVIKNAQAEAKKIGTTYLNSNHQDDIKDLLKRKDTSIERLISEEEVLRINPTINTNQ